MGGRCGPLGEGPSDATAFSRPDGTGSDSQRWAGLAPENSETISRASSTPSSRASVRAPIRALSMGPGEYGR